ncbi:SHOCT domain-containing protein [Thermodesulfobacteriota bacterium]
MKTDRIFKIIFCQVCALAILGMGTIQSGFAETPKATQKLELLFVQNATSGSFTGETLTLKGVGPTIFFTDRPNRIEGHIRTAALIKEWGKGPDSFASDPPNAALSIFDENATKSVIVELFDPKLEGHTLSYRVKILHGKIPPAFKTASLFIDMFGRGAAFIGGALVGHAISKDREPSTTTVVYHDPDTYYVRQPSSSAPKETAEEKIRKLNNLADKGYITKEEYKAQKQKILDSL